MHWIEEFSYCTRVQDKEFPENKDKAIQEVEKNLGGKVKSTRLIRMSQTGYSSFAICEALVELDQKTSV